MKYALADRGNQAMQRFYAFACHRVEKDNIMTRIFLILLLVVGLQCRKADSNITEARSVIEGNWELRKSVGGIAGTIQYAPGNGMVIKFINESQYSLINKTTMFDNGTYLLSPGATPGTWQLQLRSSITSAISTANIQLTATSLVWLASASCCDVPTIFYEKI